MLFRLALITVILVATPPQLASSEEPIVTTVLYDNYLHEEGTKPDWGFACMIEGFDKTILFDTGTKPDILLRNIDVLGVSVEDVDAIVISHNHADHTGGLYVLLKRKPDVEVYLPASFPEGFVQEMEKKGATVILVSDPVEICSGVHSTGEMGTSIHEHSLVLETGAGLVVVTGCSHPGIAEIVGRARSVGGEDVHLVFGGFHLGNHPDEQVHEIIDRFREMGVAKVGPTHCTGDGQIDLFREAYGESLVKIGTGRTLQFPSADEKEGT